MGEIAEDMVDGTCCELCGSYFIKKQDKSTFTHGYPVVCNECWDNLSDEEVQYHQKQLNNVKIM